MRLFFVFLLNLFGQKKVVALKSQRRQEEQLMFCQNVVQKLAN